MKGARTFNPRARLPALRERNPSATPRSPLYDTARWKRLRLWHLRQQPCCIDCKAQGRVNALHLEVDHVRPHRGDPALFFDPWNLATRCIAHHSQKTAREDGGFGRSPTHGK